VPYQPTSREFLALENGLPSYGNFGSRLLFPFAGAWSKPAMKGTKIWFY
jgi:hypothetical protein